MINPSAIISLGLGFDSLSQATIGFITQAVDVFYPYFGATGDYRHERKKKPPARIVKKVIQEVIKETVHTKVIPKYYAKSIDTERVIALMQYDTILLAKQYIKNEIERKIKQDQEDDDLILLFL